MYVIRWKNASGTVTQLIAQREGRWINADFDGSDAHRFSSKAEAEQTASEIFDARPNLVFTVEEASE